MTKLASREASQVEAGDEAAPAEQRRVRGAATVFSDLASMLGSRLGSVVLSLVSVVMTTRLLSPASYGTLAFYNVVTLLIFTIASAWTSTAIARYGREEIEHHGSMRNVTWARAVLTAPLIALALLVVPGLKLAGVLPPDFSWALVWLALAYGLIWIVSEHMIYLTEAAGRMKWSALALFGQQALAVSGIAILYLSSAKGTPFLIAGISFGSSLVLTAVFTKPLWRVGLWPPSLDRALLRRILLFSLPMIAFTVSQYVIKSVDLFLIRAFAGQTATGLYGVAYQGYSVLQAVGVVVPQILTPLFVSLSIANKEPVVRYYLERVVPQVSFAAATLVGFGAPFVAYVVPVVFGSEFEDAAKPLELLLVAAVLFFGTTLLAPVVILRERTKAVGLANVAAAGVNITGDVITLGPLHMGIEGPALATGAALAVIFAGYHMAGRRALGTASHFNPLLFAPLIVGVVAARELSGLTSIAVGCGVTLFCAALIQLRFKPFSHADIEPLSALNIPAPIKRRLLRFLTVVGR
jgi:O-antigen/teichoic acid export membrane protein